MPNLIFSCVESRVEKDQNLYGCFKLGPFYLNQSLLVANTLRRILLSDLEGLSIVFIKIEGVKHEYSILKGVQESVLEILSNLKQVQFKANRPVYKPQIAYLNIQGPAVINSCDIQLPPEIQCINPSQYIATLSCDGKLKVKLFICQGKRYYLQNSLKLILQKQLKKILNTKILGYLFLDAIFLPIQQVNFTIEENEKLKREFIIFEIWTKGGVHPKQSLYKAINEIIEILIPFRRFCSLPGMSKNLLISSTNFESIQNRKILNKINSTQFQKKLSSLDISNLNLALKTYFYLKKRNIHTISDLVKYSKEKFVLLDSFENKILDDIKENLLTLGFRINV